MIRGKGFKLAPWVRMISFAFGLVLFTNPPPSHALTCGSLNCPIPAGHALANSYCGSKNECVQTCPNAYTLSGGTCILATISSPGSYYCGTYWTLGNAAAPGTWANECQLATCNTNQVIGGGVPEYYYCDCAPGTTWSGGACVSTGGSSGSGSGGGSGTPSSCPDTCFPPSTCPGGTYGYNFQSAGDWNANAAFGASIPPGGVHTCEAPSSISPGDLNGINYYVCSTMNVTPATMVTMGFKQCTDGLNFFTQPSGTCVPKSGGCTAATVSLTFNPNTYAFPATLIGSSSVKTVQLQAAGATATNCSLSLSDPANFSVSPSSFASIAASGSVSFTLTASPTAPAGGKSTTITASCDGVTKTSSTFTVNATTPGSVNFSPNSFSFGTVTVGSNSTPLSIAVTNNTGADLHGCAYNLLTDSGEFGLTGNTACADLINNVACNLQLTGAPLSAGLKTIQIRVTCAPSGFGSPAPSPAAPAPGCNQPYPINPTSNPACVIPQAGSCIPGTEDYCSSCCCSYTISPAPNCW